MVVGGTSNFESEVNYNGKNILERKLFMQNL